VTLKDNEVGLFDVEPVFDPSANVQDGVSSGGGGHPDGNLVPLVPDVDYGSVDQLAVVLAEGLPDQQEEDLHPEAVQLGTPEASIEADEPASSFLVGGVLPHWLDPFLEEAVVAADLELGRHLDVVVQRPKVFHRVKVDDWLLVRLPVFALLIFEEPKGPSVLQRMLHVHFPVEAGLDLLPSRCLLLRFFVFAGYIRRWRQCRSKAILAVDHGDVRLEHDERPGA